MSRLLQTTLKMHLALNRTWKTKTEVILKDLICYELNGEFWLMASNLTNHPLPVCTRDQLRVKTIKNRARRKTHRSEAVSLFEAHRLSRDKMRRDTGHTLYNSQLLWLLAHCQYSQFEVVAEFQRVNSQLQSRHLSYLLLTKNISECIFKLHKKHKPLKQYNR